MDLGAAVVFAVVGAGPLGGRRVEENGVGEGGGDSGRDVDGAAPTDAVLATVV